MLNAHSCKKQSKDVVIVIVINLDLKLEFQPVLDIQTITKEFGANILGAY